MSDMKLYKILENFDNLESATDKLTPVTEEDMEVDESQTNVIEAGGDPSPTVTKDKNGNTEYRVNGKLHRTDGPAFINAGGFKRYYINGRLVSRAEMEQYARQQGGTADVDESQTKVQNMGNRVRVTTDGDTTEFDDAETAAAFMGDGDDDNQFATEDADEKQPFWFKDRSPKERKKAERKLASDAKKDADVFGSDDKDSEYNDTDIDESKEIVEGSPPARKGDLNTPENQMLVGLIQQHFPEDDENDIWNWLVSAADYGQPLTVEEYGDYRAFGEDGLVKEAGTGCMENEEDGPEFATFDSENESHRKRLQRGTPVVLDADLFTDSNVNRRGVFVNRSPSGAFGTVVRDFDGKEINIHLSDIKSADLVNNSIYEEFELNFEEMLAEDDDEKKEKWGVFSKGGSIGGKKDGKPVATFNSSADAKEDAKRRRKGLSKGEKSYYKMGYSVKKINEDITMTQTTNLENPENDTTTVTGVGPDAGEELAAMMANAGLNTGEYASMDAPPIDAGEVDTGEPTAEPVQMGMGDMIGMMDEPETMESEFDPNDDFTNTEFGMSVPQASSPSEFDPADTFTNAEPSNADLDAIDSDPEWDLNFEETAEPIREDDIAYLTNEIAQAIVDGADIYELIHDESVPQKDREGLQRDIDELMLGGDNELTAYENLAQRIYDMYADADLGEARDIEHANTPNEIVAGVDMVTHGTSGGLNRPKRMYKPAGNRHGDNAMQRPMEGEEDWDPELDFDKDMISGYPGDLPDAERDGIPGDIDKLGNEIGFPDDEVEEALSPEMQRQKELDQEKIRVDRDMSRSSKGSRLRGKGRGTGRHDRSVRFGLGEDEIEEELSPEMQKRKEAGIAKARADRDWSTRSKGSRLTGRGRGTDRDDKSIRFGLGETADEFEAGAKTVQSLAKADGKVYSELTYGEQQKYVKAAKAEQVDETEDQTFVNEHESVDSFLDLYKEFTIRTKK